MTSRKEHGEYLLRAVVAMNLDTPSREILARTFGLDPKPLALARPEEAVDPQGDAEIAMVMRMPLAKVTRLRARALVALRRMDMVGQANREIRGTRDAELRRVDELDRGAHDRGVVFPGAHPPRQVTRGSFGSRPPKTCTFPGLRPTSAATGAAHLLFDGRRERA